MDQKHPSHFWGLDSKTAKEWQHLIKGPLYNTPKQISASRHVCKYLRYRIWRIMISINRMLQICRLISKKTKIIKSHLLKYMYIIYRIYMIRMYLFDCLSVFLWHSPNLSKSQKWHQIACDGFISTPNLWHDKWLLRPWHVHLLGLIKFNGLSKGCAVSQPFFGWIQYVYIYA